MRPFSAAQLETLSGGNSNRLALLFDLAHPDGAIRMSTLPFDWQDGAGVMWTGGAGVLSIAPDFTRLGVEGGATTITWSGANAALMAYARDGKVLGARLTRYLAFLDDDAAQVGDLIVTFAGVCEQPEIDTNPANPTITVTVESRTLLLSRANPFRYTPESQALYYSGDTGFDFVAELQNAAV